MPLYRAKPGVAVAVSSMSLAGPVKGVGNAPAAQAPPFAPVTPTELIVYAALKPVLYDEADRVGGVALTVRVAPELAVPLLLVVMVKVGDEVGAVNVKATSTLSPTAILQLAAKVTTIVVVDTAPAVPFWRQVGESITWMPVGTLPRATLDRIVMALPVVNAAVALKNTSSVVELEAVVAVGESVTLLTAPVSEPIR